MNQKIDFTKISAAGNDFIMVDNRSGKIKGRVAEIAKSLCDRHLSIGADGLILLERSKKADIRMRILNSDGSEAEMCGNGVRCLAKFAVDKKIAKPKLTAETLAGIIHAEIKKDVVKARLSDPKELKLGIALDVEGARERLHFINTGVPHTVRLSEKAEEVYDVERLGRAIRFHEHFAPKGTNVNFVSVTGPAAIQVRTYERGVEGETLACGTGSTASALVSAALKNLASPVTVKTSGGDTLKVYFSRKNGSFTDVYLEGKVRTNFEGRVAL